MVSVAKRLVFGVAAAAKPDGGASAKTELFAFRVHHGEVPFDANGTIIEYDDFSCHGSIVADSGRYNGRMRRLAILGGVVFPALVLGQTLPNDPPDILLFARARTKMQDHLAHQPNYVCLETLERTTRDPLKKRSTLLDVLRLEVAYVGRKEMYSWPGSNRFDDTDLTDMVPAGGSIGTGTFATHAHNLFLTNIPRIMPGQWTVVDGRRMARYPYEVPEMVSGYRLRVSRGDWAVVGYYGSVWVDAEREEVARIEVVADQIPLRLGMREARSMIYYGDVRIGGEMYRLPVRTTQTTMTFNESQSRNEGRYTACRQFVGESKLSFGDPPAEEEAAPPPQAADITLPEGLTLQVQLTAPIDSETSKTGDPIEAVLAAPIKQKKQILFEKGSRVEGRLVRMQKVGGTIRAEIQFISITGGNRTAAFTARPQMPAGPPQPPPGWSQQPQSGRPQFEPGQKTGSVVITIEGSRLTLLKGSRSLWLTVAPAKKDSIEC